LRRIGVFGGTFNPVHTAHLIMAEDVREQVHLDKVLFIPSANPPHKNADGIPDAYSRLEMINMAIEGNAYFESSDIEIKSAQHSKSYTVNTLMALRELYKNEPTKLYLIIGMDNLVELHTWKDPGKLFALSEVVVINRPGFLIQDVNNEYSNRVIFVPALNIEISSTEIRNRVKENRSVKYLVPEKVEKYITGNKLYI
jgi:nicotinate-nucleotide adenylyltransferase